MAIGLVMGASGQLGDGGALGHPKVFLTLVDGEVKCPYCDKKFVLKAGVTPESGH